MRSDRPRMYCRGSPLSLRWSIVSMSAEPGDDIEICLRCSCIHRTSFRASCTPIDCLSSAQRRVTAGDVDEGKAGMIGCGALAR